LNKVRAWRVVYLRPAADKCPQWRQIERKIGGLWLATDQTLQFISPIDGAPNGAWMHHASWHLSMLIDERKMNHDDCCATQSESYYYLLPNSTAKPLRMLDRNILSARRHPALEE
jgi:hypothetical protein